MEDGWSGGPLFVSGPDGTPVITGVTSMAGEILPDKKKNIVDQVVAQSVWNGHVSVPFHLDWIKSSLKKLGCSDEVQSPDEISRRKKITGEEAKLRKERTDAAQRDAFKAETAKRLKHFEEYYGSLDQQGFMQAAFDYLHRNPDGPKLNERDAEISAKLEVIQRFQNGPRRFARYRVARDFFSSRHRFFFGEAELLRSLNYDRDTLSQKIAREDFDLEHLQDFPMVLEVLATTMSYRRSEANAEQLVLGGTVDRALKLAATKDPATSVKLFVTVYDKAIKENKSTKDAIAAAEKMTGISK
jgi:hypothetical protein